MPGKALQITYLGDAKSVPSTTNAGGPRGRLIEVL